METMPALESSSPYGWTKVMIERILTDYCTAHPDFGAVLLRYFNPIGSHGSGLLGDDPNGIPNNLMPYIVRIASGKLEHLTRPSEAEKRQALPKQMFAEIGENCYIEPPLHANWGGHHVHFGKNVYANWGLTLVDDIHIHVGDYTMLWPNVVLATAAHPLVPHLREQGYQYNLPVRIGRNCWLGAGVIVLPGITIGDNVVIGAGSVDIPSNFIAVGNPCRILRHVNEP